MLLVHVRRSWSDLPLLCTGYARKLQHRSEAERLERLRFRVPQQILR